MKNLLVILSVVLFINCQSEDQNVKAQKIVDKAIAVACDGHCETAEIDFDFRDKHYRSKKNNGEYSYSRRFKNATVDIEDAINNNGFQRSVHGTPVKMTDSLIPAISESINSVHYFAQLPYGLNSPAVNKEFLGETIIKDAPYYKIGVTFSEEGGGSDFEDKFVYWIHKTNYTVDYLAYSYLVNGGGIRFREAFNPRTVGGIRFADYNNYKPSGSLTDIKTLDAAFEAGELKLLSKIILENVVVN